MRHESSTINKRPVTKPKSMPPTGDEHAKLKTRPPALNARRKKITV